MPNRSKAAFPEIQEIRDDLDSLKTNVVELTRHLRSEGEDQANMIAEKARKKVAMLRKTGFQEMQKVERRIKAHPAQSLAIAFAVGAVASLLAGRRSFR
jgi:ElaB/YqjD/DUF883 family membrane-anchored ribosome-binding protein